jgi:hypothetical protein
MTMAVDNPENPSPEESTPPPGSDSLAGKVLDLYLRPSVLFSELPRCNRALGAFFLLIICYGLYGWGIISTGVLDYEIDRQAQKEASNLREHFQASKTDEDSEKLTSKLDSAEKTAIFSKQLERVKLLMLAPLGLLIRLSLLAGILFMIIALRGGKPNFQLLFGITVFAALVEIPKLICRLLLISQLQVSRVETSAAAFIRGSEGSGLWSYMLLRRFDPFDIWFFILVAVGLYYTGQMRRRGAIITTCLLAVFAGLTNCFLDIPELATITIPTGNS